MFHTFGRSAPRARTPAFAVGRPARHRRQAVAAHPPHAAAPFIVGDIDAADAVAIRVERDPLAVQEMA